MSYCTLEDLKKKLEPGRLIELTDTVNNPPSTIDAGMVSRAVQDADSIIDSYLSRRYAVPINPVPPSLRQASAIMAIYSLYVFRSADPEVWRKRYEDVIGWLEEVSTGTAELDGTDSAPGPAVDTTAGFSADERLFGRDNLEGF